MEKKATLDGGGLLDLLQDKERVDIARHKSATIFKIRGRVVGMMYHT